LIIRLVNQEAALIACLLLLLLPPAGAMGSLWLMIPNEYDLKQVGVFLRNH
jgi:hypothetical protein